jgi:hypothetical protein
VIVPVGLTPLASVAVSDTCLPSRTAGDAVVVSVGTAAAATSFGALLVPVTVPARSADVAFATRLPLSTLVGDTVAWSVAA